MARVIFHNSNYASVVDRKTAIDRYLLERNEHFKKFPKRAGNKIWKYERVILLKIQDMSGKNAAHNN